LYSHWLTVHRALWDSPVHDRNAHYLFSLRLAADVRQGHVFALLGHLATAAIWPPLHGVLAGAVLLAGGLDYRLAVLPSLGGWLLTVLFGFLVARRAVRRGGNLAGLTAALFILASPAYRAYATDIMLESLGAGLSLVVLYCYLLTLQADTDKPWPGRCLGLALTALFLHKYNYWLLVLLALAADEVGSRPRAAWDLAWATASNIDWPRWLRSQLRAPLNYVLLVLLVLSAAVLARGDRPVVVQGRAVSLYPPHNLIQAAYVVFFLRLVGWWKTFGRDGSRQLDRRLRQVVGWHLWPAAVYLLLPKHASYFAWYVGPTNAHPGQKFDILAGLTEYSGWAVTEYHLTAWWAVLAGGLCLAALLLGRSRLAPGGAAVLWLLVIGAALTVTHPNHKARCLHSWLPAGWVLAGVGLSALVYGRLTARLPRARPWLAGAAVAGLGWAALPTLTAPGHAIEGGPHPEAACWLDPVDFCRPDLDRARRAIVLASVPVRALAQWTVLERDGRLDRLEENWAGFAGPGVDNRAGFLHWLKGTDCDTLVFFDRLAPGPVACDEFPDCAAHAQLRDLLLVQRAFGLVKEQAFPRHGCRVQVWKRGWGTAAYAGR
jgi:hypothetical protein